MKKAIKLMAIVVAMLVIMTVEANDSTFHIEVVGEKKMKVEAHNIHGVATTYILDQEGNVLYQKELVGESDAESTYDLGHLANGTYKFLIEDEFKIQSVPFAIVDSKLKVGISEREKFFFPTYIQEGKSLIVKQLSNESSDLYITIRSQKGEDILSDKLRGQLGLIGKKYQLRPGEYTLTLSSNDYVLTEVLTFD